MITHEETNEALDYILRSTNALNLEILRLESYRSIIIRQRDTISGLQVRLTVAENRCKQYEVTTDRNNRLFTAAYTALSTLARDGVEHSAISKALENIIEINEEEKVIL